MTTLNCDKWDARGRQTSEDVADRSSRTDTASRYWLPMTATDGPLADMQWQHVTVLRPERRFSPPYFEKPHKTTKTSAVFPKPFATKNNQTNNNNNKTTTTITKQPNNNKTKQKQNKKPQKHIKTNNKQKHTHKTKKISKIKWKKNKQTKTKKGKDRHEFQIFASGSQMAKLGNRCRAAYKSWGKYILITC